MWRMLPSDFALLYYFCCLYTYSHREHSNSHYRESGFLSHIPRFTKKHCVWKFSRLGQFVCIVAATCRWRWVWGIGGMILAGENRRTRKKFYPMLLCRPHIRHGLTLHWSRAFSTRLSHGTAKLLPSEPSSMSVYSVTTATMLNAHIKHTFVTRFKDMWLFLWVFFKNKIFSTNLHTADQ